MSNKVKITNPKDIAVTTTGLTIEPEGSVTMTKSEWSELLEKNKYVRRAVSSGHLVVSVPKTRKRK